MNPDTFVGELRSNVSTLVDAYQNLRNRAYEYQHAGGQAWLETSPTLTAPDAAVTVADIVNVMYTFSELETMMNTGHATNLLKAHP